MTEQPTFDAMLDFMEDENGFDTPLMPSTKHREGKKYHINSPDAATGLRLAAVSDIVIKQQRKMEISELDIKRLRLDDDDERDFIDQVLNTETVDEMIGDGVRWEHIKRMSLYAFTYFTVSREAADSAVKNGLLQGKVMPPNRAAKRKNKTKSTGSVSAGSKKITPKK